MALSQNSWDQIMRVVAYKLGEIPPNLRGNIMDPNTVLGTMRDNWELLCDHDAVVAYLHAKDLAEKKKSRDEEQAKLAALDAEIEELETQGS
jgi:hypothetical protein